MPTPSGTWNGATLGPYAGGVLARFLLEHTWCNVGKPPGAALSEFPVTVVLAAALEISPFSYEHMLVEFGKLVGSGKNLSSVMMLRVSRNPASHVDNYTDFVFGLSFDLHLRIRSLGFGPDQYSGI